MYFTIWIYVKKDFLTKGVFLYADEIKKKQDSFSHPIWGIAGN
ncbi:MAG: hypothetical protein K0S01_3518 [Herbinix sp.]|nr:hypothetical protein [Herbinix sp.]